MPKASGAPAVSPEAALRAFADVLAPYLAPHFKMKAHEEASYFSQYDSPLGRKRHLKLVRAGKLIGKKVGRLVLVRKDVVRGYVEHCPARGGVRSNGSDGQIEAEQADLLADWGLVGRG